MFNFLRRAALGAAASLALICPALADGLRVTPISLEVLAPGAATTLTLRNDGRSNMTIQARSFRWSQTDGKEALQRTSDVVVSPPTIKLGPGASQTIRVVRTSKAALKAEEAYRVVINEIPDQSRAQSGSVAFATELRIPVFFVARGARSADVSWSLRNSGGVTMLVAQNRGDMRLRLADLKLSSGSSSVERKGLVGYVLGGSTMQWPIAKAGKISNVARVKATTNLGTLDAQVKAR